MLQFGRRERKEKRTSINLALQLLYLLASLQRRQQDKHTYFTIILSGQRERGEKDEKELKTNCLRLRREREGEMQINCQPKEGEEDTMDFNFIECRLKRESEKLLLLHCVVAIMKLDPTSCPQTHITQKRIDTEVKPQYTLQNFAALSLSSR